MKLPKVAEEDLEEGKEYIFDDGDIRVFAYIDSRGKIYESGVEPLISYGYISDFKGQFYGPIELEEE